MVPRIDTDLLATDIRPAHAFLFPLGLILGRDPRLIALRRYTAPPFRLV